MKTLKYLTVVFAMTVALPQPGGFGQTRVPPSLVRIRVVLSTDAPAGDLVLDTGTIVHAAVLSDGRRVRVRAEGNHVSFTSDSGGTPETHVRLLVAGIRADARVHWHLTLSASAGSTQAAETHIEVYNENQQGRARLVDRFSTHSDDSIFESAASLLFSGGPLRIGNGPRPLVLGFFYAWALHYNWSSDRLLDQPLYLYSTELPDEVAHSLSDARAAGLDGVIVSWRGDTDWNDRRLRIVLDQAQKLGLQVSILVESAWTAEAGHVLTNDLVAAKMRLWLEKAFDLFTAHPAFLRTDGLPVMFVYAADNFTLEDWRTIVQDLKRGSRKMFLMGDSLDPAYLETFSGAFTYTTASIVRRELGRFYSDQALRTQAFNLLHGGPRRVGAATVVPGYDDSRLAREATLVVDRANGALYDAQWQAAVASEPDWMLVTSWNEFWENTHIEPSVLYGRRYQDRTRAWSQLFHRQRLDSCFCEPGIGTHGSR